jgi:hypothetical protein
MGLARLEGKPQRLAGTEKVRLAYELAESARPQPVGEWSVGLLLREKIIH